MLIIQNTDVYDCILMLSCLCYYYFSQYTHYSKNIFIGLLAKYIRVYHFTISVVSVISILTHAISIQYSVGVGEKVALLRSINVLMNT